MSPLTVCIMWNSPSSGLAPGACLRRQMTEEVLLMMAGVIDESANVNKSSLTLECPGRDGRRGFEFIKRFNHVKLEIICYRVSNWLNYRFCVGNS